MILHFKPIHDIGVKKKRLLLSWMENRPYDLPQFGRTSVLRIANQLFPTAFIVLAKCVLSERLQGKARSKTRAPEPTCAAPTP